MNPELEGPKNNTISWSAEGGWVAELLAHGLESVKNFSFSSPITGSGVEALTDHLRDNTPDGWHWVFDASQNGSINVFKI